jgi:hypothetical protein
MLMVQPAMDAVGRNTSTRVDPILDTALSATYRHARAVADLAIRAVAVESDFFDWVLDNPAGRDFIVWLARHTARFRLHDVEIDVLKLLYEGLIDRSERHGLGEYYTPDWLAAKMVRRAIDKPLERRVLDPACGSGTFLFHAVRHHLAAAARKKTDPATRAEKVCTLIAGMDIHPVAAIIARVTYLLALGEARQPGAATFRFRSTSATLCSSRSPPCSPAAS